MNLQILNQNFQKKVNIINVLNNLLRYLIKLLNILKQQIHLQQFQLKH